MEIIQTELVAWHEDQGVFDLSDLTALEVVACDRYIESLMESTDDSSVQNRLAIYLRRLDRAVITLPSTDPDFAAEVYTAYADSSIDAQRVFIAGNIDDLTKANHDSGLPIWHRLIRDIGQSVRYAAASSLKPAQAALERGDRDAVDKTLRNLGISSLEAHELLEAHANAELGIGRVSIGGTALSKLLAT